MSRESREIDENDNIPVATPINEVEGIPFNEVYSMRRPPQPTYNDLLNQYRKYADSAYLPDGVGIRRGPHKLDTLIENGIIISKPLIINDGKSSETYYLEDKTGDATFGKIFKLVPGQDRNENRTQIRIMSVKIPVGRGHKWLSAIKGREIEERLPENYSGNITYYKLSDDSSCTIAGGTKRRSRRMRTKRRRSKRSNRRFKRSIK